MAKLLRPNEAISFLQTRAPAEMWRYIKGLALIHAADGTATRLCTDNMLVYLAERPWVHQSWLRPQDLKRSDGEKTGYVQVNLPLSNMDLEGHIIVSQAYLKRAGLYGLYERDKHALKKAVETGQFSRLVYAAAAGLEVSAATLGYTFLHWLGTERYAGAPAQQPPLDVAKLAPATPVKRSARKS